MVRKAAILALFFCTGLFAQEQSAFYYKSMLKASATLCPGIMLNRTQTNIYVHGMLEYYPEERVSLRGDGFWFTGTQQKPPLLEENSSLLFGGLYHFQKNRLDFFIGLQAGVNFTKPTDKDFNNTIQYGNTVVNVSGTNMYNLKVTPSVTPFTGLNFFPGKYVNFFLELRYANGRYFGYENGSTLYLNELRVSAGLGFQLHLKKNS